ncbi:hypothetical protein BH11ARM2_BH11ARM2_00780 [soil metagenome]
MTRLPTERNAMRGANSSGNVRKDLAIRAYPSQRLTK